VGYFYDSTIYEALACARDGDQTALTYFLIFFLVRWI